MQGQGRSGPFELAAVLGLVLARQLEGEALEEVDRGEVPGWRIGEVAPSLRKWSNKCCQTV